MTRVSPLPRCPCRAGGCQDPLWSTEALFFRLHAGYLHPRRHENAGGGQENGTVHGDEAAEEDA